MRTPRPLGGLHAGRGTAAAAGQGGFVQAFSILAGDLSTFCGGDFLRCRDYSKLLVSKGEKPLDFKRCETVEEVLQTSDVSPQPAVHPALPALRPLLPGCWRNCSFFG